MKSPFYKATIILQIICILSGFGICLFFGRSDPALSDYGFIFAAIGALMLLCILLDACHDKLDPVNVGKDAQPTIEQEGECICDAAIDGTCNVQECDGLELHGFNEDKCDSRYCDGAGRIVRCVKVPPKQYIEQNSGKEVQPMK